MANKLTPEQIAEIRELRPRHSLTFLAKKFGVSRVAIQYHTNGNTKKKKMLNQKLYRKIATEKEHQRYQESLKKLYGNK